MSKFKFDRMLSILPSVKLKAMQVLAVETQGYFAASFGKQGLGGEKWEEVQRRKPGTVAYTVASPWLRQSPILYNSGNLYDKTARSLSKLDASQFTLINPLKYAAAQNEGNRNMPARPFMKQTSELTTIQLATLKAETGRIWKVS